MTELLKPIYHPLPYPDEAPISYLIRVSEANRFNSFRWLYHDPEGGQKQFSLHPRVILAHLRDSPWTGFGSVSAHVEPYCMLPDIELGHVILRFCPKCLDEEPYYRMHWQLRASVACAKHQCWLVDTCPDCGQELRLSIQSSIVRCRCGTDLPRLALSHAPAEVIRYQQFIDGSTEYHQQERFWLSDTLDPACLSLDFRVQLARVLAQWQPADDNQFDKTGSSPGLSSMMSARVYASLLSRAFFSSAENFEQFLETLHHRIYEDQAKGDHLFRRFYKSFCRMMGNTCQPLTQALFNYINHNWHYALSQKNTLFTDSTVQEHPWIPLQAASKRYDVGKSIIRRAVKSGEVQSKVSRYPDSGRQFTLVYAPDIINHIAISAGQVTGVVAASLLGVTKKQLHQLLESGYLEGESPVDSSSSTWSIERAKLQELLEKLLHHAPAVEHKLISLPEALRKIGNGIKHPIVPLLQAIEGGELGTVYRESSSVGLRGLYLSEDRLKTWYDIRVGNIPAGTYPIPFLVKALGVDKKLIEELVDASLLQSVTTGSRRRMCIPQDAIETFKERYVLLSKLAVKSGLDHSELMGLFDSCGIKTIDYDYPSDKKLNCRIYYRHELLRVSEVSTLVRSLEDWAYKV